LTIPRAFFWPSSLLGDVGPSPLLARNRNGKEVFARFAIPAGQLLLDRIPLRLGETVTPWPAGFAEHSHAMLVLGSGMKERWLCGRPDKCFIRNDIGRGGADAAPTVSRS